MSLEKALLQISPFLCHPCNAVRTTEVYDRGSSCYTSRMYCFLSWVRSGLKFLAPEESWVPSARNTLFLLCKKQQMLPLWALQVGGVFAFPGSWWGKCVTLEESRFHVPVVVFRGMQHLKCWLSSYQAPISFVFIILTSPFFFSLTLKLPASQEGPFFLQHKLLCKCFLHMLHTWHLSKA